jgi:hypothetical protein
VAAPHHRGGRQLPTGGPCAGRTIVDQEIAKLPGKRAEYAEARATFVDVATADDFAEFLILPAYERMP